jgi:N-acetyl-gamma-glutamyl-phosphate reductase
MHKLNLSIGGLVMRYKVFVDGQEGTTGLKIYDYLSVRDDIELLYIKPENRKDIEFRRILLNEADIVFLCLPDITAKESVPLVTITIHALLIQVQHIGPT